MASADTLRLEGFSATLKGQRLWITGKALTLGQQILSRLAVLEEELLGRGRTFLLTYNTRDIVMRWSTKVKWDATFRIRESHDLRVAAQAIQNALKPVRVVWVGDEPPIAFLNAISTADVTILAASTANPKTGWSAIFWEPTADVKQIEEGLVPRMGFPAVQAMNLPTVLQELRASNVGLAWSSIGEADKGGAVYWYDADEGLVNQEAPLDRVEAGEVLREVAAFLQGSK